MPHPEKILAIKFRSLGDTVLMTAPMAALRKAYPDAEIHLAVTAQWEPIFRANPNVDKIWPVERHNEKTARARAIARLALSLRREQFDCVINFHASPSSAALAYSTGAKIRAVHYHGHRDKNRFSTVTIPGKGEVKPVIERDQDVIRSLGVEVAQGMLPEIFLSAEEREFAHRWLRDKRLVAPVLTIGLGASRPTKNWGLERFAQVADHWVAETGGSIVALLGTDEQLVQKSFEFQARELVRSERLMVARGLDLRQVAALIKETDLFLGNDSGPKHMAVAVGTPTVTVFGPEDPFEWHPYPKDLHPYFFVEGLACRKDAEPGMPAWCGLHICTEQKHRCMTQVGVKEVFDQCLKLLESRQ